MGWDMARGGSWMGELESDSDQGSGDSGQQANAEARRPELVFGGGQNGLEKMQSTGD